MASPADKNRKILFLDDDRAFLDTIHQAAARWNGGRWEIHLADNAGQALSIIQDHAIDLAVVDIEMPVVDGLQFLNLLNRKHPHLQKVVLTAYADNDNYRTACLGSGAELFLEKPLVAEGLDSIFTTLNELMRWQPEEGFRGVLRRVGIQDVIQMECLSRHSVILEIVTARARGEIFIRDGEIIHAAYGDKTGEPAFNFLMTLNTGEFNLKEFKEPPGRTLEGQWEFILMEAMRQRDEASEAPPPPEEPLELSALPGIQAIAAAPPPPPPPPAPAANRIPDRPRSNVNEVLVCSAKGEVLYEHQCADLNMRISLMEFMSQKARQVSNGLGLGKFERIELESPKSRAVLKVRDDYTLLVRASQPAESFQNLKMA